MQGEVLRRTKHISRVWLYICVCLFICVHVYECVCLCLWVSVCVCASWSIDGYKTFQWFCITLNFNQTSFRPQYGENILCGKVLLFGCKDLDMHLARRSVKIKETSVSSKSESILKWKKVIWIQVMDTKIPY